MAGGLTLRAASLRLLEQARAGELPQSLQRHLRESRSTQGRPSAGGLVSLATLNRWYHADTLLPSAGPKPGRAKPWHAPFFALTDRPQKPTLTVCHEQLLAAWRPEWADPAGSPPPSYDACWRAYRDRGEDEKLQGRHTGSARRARTYYRERDWSDFDPFEEVHADGWHTHFLAPREADGVWVALEVWHFHCVRTRFVPPFGIDYTENTDVILAALRECIQVGGVPAIWQTDHSGSVKKADVAGVRRGADEQDTEQLGSVADRLGITWLPPKEVGNSNANGIAEHFGTWLDEQSRTLATYMNPDRQDERTFVRVRRLLDRLERLQRSGSATDPEQVRSLRAQIEREGRGYLFASESDARAWLLALVPKWNHKPHSGLPSVRDPATGKRRHQTPTEALDAARRAGWQMVAMTAAQLNDAFRPHIRKTVRRGVVTLHNKQRYFCASLAAIEGHEVLVVPHEDDPTQVWIKRPTGELITVARIDGAVPGRLQSTRDAAQLKRARARVRSHERAIEQIEAALQPVLEHAPTGAALAGMWSQSIGLPAVADVVEVQARALPDPLPGPLPELRADAPTPTGRAVNLPPLRRPLAPHEDPEVIARVMREIDEAEARRAADMAAQMAKWHADVAAADAAKAAAAAPQQPPPADPSFDRAAAG
jgi:putative transposase